MTRKNWSNLKWGENGRSKEEAIVNASIILKNILNDGLKNKLNLNDNQAPTRRQLEANDHKNFVSAYSRYGLKLNEIIKKACFLLATPWSRTGMLYKGDKIKSQNPYRLFQKNTIFQYRLIQWPYTAFNDINRKKNELN